jgi:hypothetical protein
MAELVCTAGWCNITLERHVVAQHHDHVDAGNADPFVQLLQGLRRRSTTLWH